MRVKTHIHPCWSMTREMLVVAALFVQLELHHSSSPAAEAGAIFLAHPKSKSIQFPRKMPLEPFPLRVT